MNTKTEQKTTVFNKYYIALFLVVTVAMSIYFLNDSAKPVTIQSSIEAFMGFSMLSIFITCFIVIIIKWITHPVETIKRFLTYLKDITIQCLQGIGGLIGLAIFLFIGYVVLRLIYKIILFALA